MSKKPVYGSNTKDARMRAQLAQEAARIIAEEGIKDFHVAKQKAAIRLHAPHTHNLPRNDEIHVALLQYQRLFKESSQPQVLKKLRQTASKVMAFFQDFEPRLVGSVLDGTATEHSDINIHLFTDSVEAVSLFLIDRHVPYELGSQYVTLNNNDVVELPCFNLIFEEIDIQLTVFKNKELRHPPRSPINGKPMERISKQKLDELLVEPVN